jgi:hypothetical protein
LTVDRFSFLRTVIRNKGRDAFATLVKLRDELDTLSGAKAGMSLIHYYELNGQG